MGLYTGLTTLDAYNNTSAITGNAVDIFIYDTSKDSDGGAWRKRTQATSWYNEALNTATRGARKEFPSVAVIVAEGGKVTIYDGDTPDLDMWMVFLKGGGNGIGNSTPTSVTAINGQVSTATTGALFISKFLTDQVDDWYLNQQYLMKGNLAQRNDAVGFSLVADVGIVSATCNDVAMTVLPNAPIDSTTGLPVPTILVVTANGESVIKDDGTVVNSVHMLQIDSCFITEDYRAVFSRSVGSGQGFYSGPSLIGLQTGWSVVELHQYDNASKPAIRAGATNPTVVGMNHGSDTGLVVIKENTTTPTKGSVAYITSKYNTGYMTGDIRGSWNVDTDVTSLGAELVTNGTFDSGTGWSAGGNWSISSGMAQITSGTGASFLQQAVSPSVLEAGKQYSVTATVSTTSGSLQPRIANSSYGSSFPNGTSTQLLTAGSTTSETVLFYANSWVGTLDNVSVVLAVPDRSVKGNGLAVHGTPTVSAVATGAELKCISGFSSSNYLEQPYNSDLDFGTGDFSVSGWFNSPGVGGGQTLFSKGDNVNGINMWMAADLKYMAIYILGSAVVTPHGAYANNVWNNVVAKRDSGVVTVWINGVLLRTLSNPSNASYTTTSKVGVNCNAATKLALMRISATAPSAEQILEIYNAEKPMFQENAKCTLNGTSDAVQCMAYDDSNSELLVGTSSSLSVFKGLRRVDEESGNFTEVSQQGGMRVTESS